MSTPDDVRAALDTFDRAFAAGDAEALTDCFADDAQLLLLYGDPILGRDAIRAHWTDLFDRHDTSAWRTEQVLLDVIGDRAYALSTYTETLVPRSGGPSLLVRGRLVQFLRHDANSRWRVTVVLNSHSRPVERLEPDDSGPPVDAGTMGS